MTGHPSHDDDPDGDAAVARVNAIRAARGLAPIVERDPREVRADLVADRDAMMVAVAVLHRPGCGATVPDAIDHALKGKPSAAAFDLPPGVARVILQRVGKRHQGAVLVAFDAELTRFAARVAAAPEHVRGLAHLAADRLAVTVRSAIAASIAVVGSGAQLPGFTGPAPERADDLAQAADFAAAIAYADLIDRLQRDLLTMAGLP